MLESETIDILEGTDFNKTNASKEYDICHYCYFLDRGFKYEPYLCNGCNDLMQKAMSFNDFAISSFKESDYRIHFSHISKDDAINTIKNYNLNEKSGFL